MRLSRRESAAAAVFTLRQRSQQAAKRRLDRLAEANPDKVRAYLAKQPTAEVRNCPAMMRLKRITAK